MKPKIMAKKGSSKFEGSSEEPGPLGVASDAPGHDRFAKNVTDTAPSTTSAVLDDDEASCPDNRVIDTDNTEWEDSNEEESSKSGGDETMSFHRIQLGANPPRQRQSLITLALQPTQHHGRARRLGNPVPKSSLLTDVQRARTLSPRIRVSTRESDGTPTRTRQRPSRAPAQSQNGLVRSSSQPIPPTSHSANEPVVFSPTTTRLNMIATELPEPLLRQIIWEGEEKTLTARSVLKRRRRYGDATSLSQSLQRAHMTRDNSDIVACSWDQDFPWQASAGYHAKGW